MSKPALRSPRACYLKYFLALHQFLFCLSRNFSEILHEIPNEISPCFSDSLYFWYPPPPHSLIGNTFITLDKQTYLLHPQYHLFTHLRVVAFSQQLSSPSLSLKSLPHRGAPQIASPGTPHHSNSQSVKGCIIDLEFYWGTPITFHSPPSPCKPSSSLSPGETCKREQWGDLKIGWPIFGDLTKVPKKGKS